MGAIASEWVKLRSVRSTYVLLALSLAAIGLLALMVNTAVDLWDSTPARRDTIILSRAVGFPSWMVSLFAGIAGVLAMTSDNRRTAFTARPSRGSVLVAKAVVLMVTVAGVALVTEVAAFAASRAVIGDRTLLGHTEPLSTELPFILGSAGTVAVYAVLGLALGALLRSTAGAVIVLALYWYLLPVIALNLPRPWDSRVSSLLLQQLPAQLTSSPGLSVRPELLLSPVAAGAAMAAYVVLALGAAWLVLRRRDA